GMDERRLDEGGARVSRGALERTDPFARDRVHQIRASERASQIARVDQRGRQQTIDGGAEPTAPRWDEDESRSVRPDRDRSWRCRQHFAGHPRAMPRWTQPDQRDLVTQCAELAIERAREQLGATDAREKLLRDDDAHAGRLGEGLVRWQVRTDGALMRALDAVHHA